MSAHLSDSLKAIRNERTGSAALATVTAIRGKPDAQPNQHTATQKAQSQNQSAFPSAVAPDCPIDIEADPLASEAWHYYCPLLIASGNLSKADRNILKSLCLTISMLEAARRDFREGGEVRYKTNRSKDREPAKAQAAPNSVMVTGRRGNMVRNPLLPIVLELQRTEARYCQELGLTPKARGLNYAVAKAVEKSEWDALDA
jgi:phage terminase small subunit